MVDENLLSRLYSARLDELRDMAISHDLSKSGNVEQLRARLINELALADRAFLSKMPQGLCRNLKVSPNPWPDLRSRG